MLSCKRIQSATRTPVGRMLGMLFWLGVLWCLSETVVWAETVYVSDEIKLTVRSGPGTDRKILDIVSTGEKMELLEDGDEWVLVRLENGKEGWVLKRYLSSEKPSQLKLAELQTIHGRLSTRSEEVLQENEALKAANEKINTALEEKTKALEELTRSYDELKKISDASSFQMRKNIILLVSGAGILFFGIVLGLVMKRQRRKTMYMV
jgi:SH3 domain protein